jgi:hypothetical protein
MALIEKTKTLAKMWKKGNLCTGNVNIVIMENCTEEVSRKFKSNVIQQFYFWI